MMCIDEKQFFSQSGFCRRWGFVVDGLSQGVLSWSWGFATPNLDTPARIQQKVSTVMKYFVDKISAVRADTEGASKLDIKSTASEWLSSLTPLTVSEVENLVSHSANIQNNLYPAPTWLIKQFCHLLAPFITKLINVSLHTGCFPQKHKHAIVFPRLQKDNLDPTELKNYRSISDLTCNVQQLEFAHTQRSAAVSCTVVN